MHRNNRNKRQHDRRISNLAIGDASFDPLEVLGNEWKISDDGTITLKSIESIGVFIKTNNMMERLTKWADLTTETINGIEYVKGTIRGKTYYQVETAEQLQNINNKLDGNFILMNDIDLSGVEWTAIGNSSSAYTGIFNGNGHTISNLTINKPDTDYQGLFGYTKGATIQDVTLKNIDITGKKDTGGLVGGQSSGTISNCYATGSVEGSEHVGGLVGWQGGGTISNCYSTGNAKGTKYAGGLVGGSTGGTITNSYATGNVEGDSYVGGLVGILYSSVIITNSYATGDVEGTTNVGGLVGYSTGTITNSYRQSDVGDCKGGTLKDGIWFASQDSATALNAGSDTWVYYETADNPFLKENPEWKPQTGMRIQIAFEGDDEMNMYLNNEFELGRMFVDVSTSEKAAESLNEINRLLKICNDQRSLIGCDYNILESVEYSNATSNQNLSEALSTIKDADMAEVSAEYTKQQILQEAASALLVQANQTPSIALQLIYNGI